MKESFKNTYRDLSLEEIEKIQSLYFLKTIKEISVELGLAYTVFYIWEYDVKNNKEDVIQFLKSFAS